MMISLIPAAHAVRRTWWSQSSQPVNAATRYVAVHGNGLFAPQTQALRTKMGISEAGTISNLRVEVVTDPDPGSFAYTLGVNNSLTDLTCTISTGETACQDTTNIIEVAAGDFTGMQIVPSGTPTLSKFGYSYTYHTRNKRVDHWTGGLLIGIVVGGASTVYAPIDGHHNAQNTSVRDQADIVPYAGTAHDLYVDCEPAGLETWTFTLMVNDVASALTCNVSSAVGQCSDTSNTVSLSTQDRVVMKLDSTANWPTNTRCSFSMLVDVDEDGIHHIGGASQVDISNSATRYIPASTGGVNAQATETNAQSLAQEAPITDDAIIEELYAEVDTAPGGVATWTVTLRINAVNTAVSCTISGSNTQCSSTGHSISYADEDKMSVRWVPVSTPVSDEGRAAIKVKMKQGRTWNAS